MAGVSCIVVAYRHEPAELSALIAALGNDVSEVLVVDNAGDPALERALAGTGSARILRPGGNLGYAPACDLAAREATGEWLLFLNPDAMPEPGLVPALLEAADDDVAILGAQVLLPDGERVNAGDNPLHVTGLSWAGRYGEPAEDGPPRDVAVCSGAALLVRARDFHELGGYHPDSFMYYDDVDLAWRARLAGRRVRFVPRARVRHDYDFDKGAYKWFWLERNRLWSVLSNYEGRTLALLAPLLLATEAGILVLAVRDGWWREKLRAWGALWREKRQLWMWRREVQARRCVRDGNLLSAFSTAIDTPLVPLPAASLVNRVVGWWAAFAERLAGRDR
ncbi:MAG TPA: glycosyltransferase family 2 protein [Baekduia sp.]|nr:glycosyltransferase family 2 protein [Baekduia sp.]